MKATSKISKAVKIFLTQHSRYTGDKAIDGCITAYLLALSGAITVSKAGNIVKGKSDSAEYFLKFVGSSTQGHWKKAGYLSPEGELTALGRTTVNNRLHGTAQAMNNSAKLYEKVSEALSKGGTVESPKGNKLVFNREYTFK